MTKLIFLLSEKGSTLKGKTLLQSRVNSFFSEKTLFKRGFMYRNTNKTSQKLSPLKKNCGKSIVHRVSLMKIIVLRRVCFHSDRFRQTTEVLCLCTAVQISTLNVLNKLKGSESHNTIRGFWKYFDATVQNA